MKDIRQSLRYAKYIRTLGWITERKLGVNYFIKKFPLIGSFIKIQRPEKIDFNQINKLAKKYRAFQIVIEPLRAGNPQEPEALITNGFKLSKSPFLPSKTIHIDLIKSENQLLKDMHHKTRYNIKIAEKRGIKIKSSIEIEGFANFWQDCAKTQRGMFLSQKKEIIELFNAFGKNAHLLLGYHKDTSEVAERTPRMVEKEELVSGILMVRTKDIAYYMYAASSDHGKKLFAPTLVAWEAIKLAKRLKCKIFDFEGIFDDRFPLKSWLGFTRFKKSFGGKEIEYPGAFSKFLLPFF